MNRKFIKEVVRVFVFAFLGFFIAGAQGILYMPDWNAQRAALLALVGAALSAGAKAVIDLLTKGVYPAPSVGVLPPFVKE